MRFYDWGGKENGLNLENWCKLLRVEKGRWESIHLFKSLIEREERNLNLKKKKKITCGKVRGEMGKERELLHGWKKCFMYLNDININSSKAKAILDMFPLDLGNNWKVFWPKCFMCHFVPIFIETLASFGLLVKQETHFHWNKEYQ